MFLKVFRYGSKVGMKRMYQNDECPGALQIKENISYVEDHSEDHKLDIIYPQKEKDCYPFIINIHGGGFCMHSKDILYRHYGMRLAANEFAVVNINYRLAPENIYPSQVEDVLLAINFISKHAKTLKLDKENMFLVGDSAGAYLCAITGCLLSHKVLQEKYEFQTDIRCRAIAVNCGMFDFTTFMDKEIKFPMKRKTVELLFGRTDYQNNPYFEYSSVLNYINQNFPPVYLMDTAKKSFEKEALRFSNVLKNNNIDYRLKIFEKNDNLMHAFNILSKYPQSQIVLNETFEFFKLYLAPSQQ